MTDLNELQCAATKTIPFTLGKESPTETKRAFALVEKEMQRMQAESQPAALIRVIDLRGLIDGLGMFARLAPEICAEIKKALDAAERGTKPYATIDAEVLKVLVAKTKIVLRDLN